MFRTGFLMLAMAGLPAVASAEAVLSLQLATEGRGTITSATYSCAGGEPFAVQYVNAGANALALLPIDSEERVFVNVVSGSGARYVAGQYVWWSRGDTPTLENQLEKGSLVECVSAEYPAAD